MARRKLWQWKVGPHGATVTVKERTFGGSAYLYAYDPELNGLRKRSLGFVVRDAEGKLIPSAVERAKQDASDLANSLLKGSAPSGQVTVRDLFELFRREVVSAQSKSHQKDASRALELWQRFLGSRFIVTRFGPREWNAIIRQLGSGEIDPRGRRVSDPEKRRPVSNRTVQKALKVFRHACRFGSTYRTKNGGYLLDADPTRGLELPSEPNPTRIVADDDMYELLLAVADQVQTDRYNPRRSYLRELLILAAHTGRRIGAIVALRYSDWLPDEGTYGVLRWRADSDKLGKEWKAPVTPEVREAIEDLRRERLGVGDAYLFPAPRSDGHVRVDVTRKWLKKAEALAGIEHEKGFGWHSFRRMWASKRKHLSLTDVAAAGGWKDTQTLQRCYQHADPETLEAVVLEGRRLRMTRDQS